MHDLLRCTLGLGTRVRSLKPGVRTSLMSNRQRHTWTTALCRHPLPQPTIVHGQLVDLHSVCTSTFPGAPQYYHIRRIHRRRPGVRILGLRDNTSSRRRLDIDRGKWRRHRTPGIRTVRTLARLRRAGRGAGKRGESLQIGQSLECTGCQGGSGLLVIV